MSSPDYNYSIFNHGANSIKLEYTSLDLSYLKFTIIKIY